MSFKNVRNDITGSRKNLYPDLEAYIEQNYVNEKKEDGGRYFDSVRVNQLRCESYSIAYRSEGAFPKEVRQEQRRIVIPDFLQKCESSKIQEARILSCEEMKSDEYDAFQEEKENAIEERMKHLSDSFGAYLLYLIEQKNLDNVAVYKRALLDKKQFSKIKTNPKYHPDKVTVLRLCVGALLNLDETKDLLARAGYALSPCDKRDVIFSYFIEKGIYDLTEIDITLEEYGLPCMIA